VNEIRSERSPGYESTSLAVIVQIMKIASISQNGTKSCNREGRDHESHSSASETRASNW
jgi:hypothetical protein